MSFNARKLGVEMKNECESYLVFRISRFMNGNCVGQVPSYSTLACINRSRKGPCNSRSSFKNSSLRRAKISGH